MSVMPCGLVNRSKTIFRLCFAIALLFTISDGFGQEAVRGPQILDPDPSAFSDCNVGDVCFEEQELKNATVEYEYFEGIWDRLPDFDQLTPVRTGMYPFISLEPATRPDNFGFRFTAQLNIKSPGEYTFYLTSDDGSALYLDGSKLIDNDGLQQATEQSATMDLEVGLYPFSVAYFEKSGAESLTVEIVGPEFSRQSIIDFLESSSFIAPNTETTTHAVLLAPQLTELSPPAVQSVSSVDAGESEVVLESAAPEIDSVDLNNRSNEALETDIEDVADVVDESEDVRDSEVDVAELEPEEPRRPGLFQVDEDAAERALERSLVLLDALLLDPGKVDVGLDVSYGVDSQSEPVLVVVTDDESGTTSDTVGVEEDTIRRTGVVLDLRFGLPRDSQINFSAPFTNSEIDSNLRLAGSSVESESESTNESGPFSIGLVKTLFKEKGRIPDLIGSATYSDGGDIQEASSFTLGLTATKRQDPLIFTAGASFSRSEEVAGIRAGDLTNLSIGTVLAASPFTSLLFSVDQLFIGEATIDESNIDGSSFEAASATIGASSVVGRNLFFQGTVEFGLSDLAQDYVFTLGISKRLSLW